MTIYDRIKALRIERGLSQQELALLVGYKGRSAVSKVEAGDRDISQSMIAKYADVLGVSPAYLLTGFKEEEIEEYYPENIIPLPETRGIPLVGTIACGEPITAEENIEMLVRLDKNIAADFALRCKGDSMINSRIFDGDIVYIRQQPEVENGEIAAVLIGTEATLKKVYKYPNRLVLRPSNPMYEDMIYTGDELTTVRILGKAVAFISLVRH